MPNQSMKRWTTMIGDINWEDYGGSWGRRAKDGSWFVIKFTNMYDACGERDCQQTGMPQYHCELVRVDLKGTPRGNIESALRSCGFRLESPEYYTESYLDGNLIDERGETVDPKYREIAIVECCVGYGLGAPLHQESAPHRPVNLRARVRREAENLMRDVERLETKLDEPVNAIGSTAREFGIGDINSALRRDPATTAKLILNKMGGGIRTIKQADMLKCRFSILAPVHYRADGTCKCDDPEHQKMMISEWGYRPSQFV